MSGLFDEAEADAADRARGRNDHDTTHLDKDAKELLRSAVHRVENLEVDKQTAADGIKEVLADAKSRGLDPKIIRKVVARRKMDKTERDEIDAMIELYEGVFG